jgi:hypothetical protein
VRRVETAGEPNAAWPNATNSAGVAKSCAALAKAVVVWLAGNVLCGRWSWVERGVFQIFEIGERYPLRIVVPSKVIVTSLCVKDAVQPASHNKPIESKYSVIAGNVCAVREARGILGILNLLMWVDQMVLPLGMVTGFGWTAGRMLPRLAVSAKKWSLAPVSAIECTRGGEEPIRVGWTCILPKMWLCCYYC